MLTKHPERADELNADLGSDRTDVRARMVFVSEPLAAEVDWMLGDENDPKKHRVEIVVWSDGSVLLTPIDETGLSISDGVENLYPSQVKDLCAVCNSGYVKGVSNGSLHH